jgi:hypothetical protein
MKSSKELTMNIGSLYLVKKWHWLLFPSKESAAAAEAAHLGVTADLARRIAAYYSKEYNENVTYFSHDSYIVFLEEDGNLKKVLTSEGLIGWTWFDERYNDCFEEVKQ